jgi:hypothetical protein
LLYVGAFADGALYSGTSFAWIAFADEDDDLVVVVVFFVVFPVVFLLVVFFLAMIMPLLS